MIMSRPRLSASIVVEWYNATRARYSRGVQTLGELQRQAAAMLDEDRGLPFTLARPVELILTYNADALRHADVERTVDDALPVRHGLEVRIVPVAGGTYCVQKNRGAALSSGDILVFLDSDVVPEPGWLAIMLGAFSVGDVDAVVGNTFVDHGDGGCYSRAMALTWMFPLRSVRGPREPARMFYANNTAFRRHVFEARPFEDVPGFMHSAARTFLATLERDRITLWSVPDARASHPPPNGLRHFIMRAIAGGRARALDPHGESDRAAWRWVVADAKTVAYHVRRILRDGHKVGLSHWQKPAAIVVSSAYDVLFLAGSIVSRWFPGFMIRRFDL